MIVLQRQFPAIIIPVLCFLLIYAFAFMRAEEFAGWRTAFISAAVIWGVLISAMTELLSYFNAITYTWLLTSWSLATVVAAILCVMRFRKLRPAIRLKLPKLQIFDALSLFCLGLIGAVTGVIALVAPPNNWDSMTYHMARVVHWIQNHNVAFYPTHIDRQLYSNPWSEFAVMHLQILARGDRFANLVQWFSMIGSAIGVSLIAKRLGADRRGQIFAAVLCATIPMGILQSSSTQDDYVLSFWLVAFVYYLTRWVQDEGRNYADLLGTGASLGLAVSTHGSAYILAFPFLLWFIFSQAKALHWECWKPLLLVGALCLSLNLGHYARNFSLFGFPLGPAPRSQTGIGGFSNGVLTFAALTSNVVRNIGLHAGTPFDQVNDKLERGVNLLHRWIGIDMNDPRTTWIREQFHILRPTYHEDVAGNPIHLALIVVSSAIFAFGTKLWKSMTLVVYLLALYAGFLLFCLFLKWQPWHSRLHLPLFVLWAPLVSAVILSTVNQKIIAAVILFLILSAIPPVVWNRSRPLPGERSIFKVSREDQYFSNALQWRDPYLGAGRFLVSQKCRQIGLELDVDDWEYPLWVALQPAKRRSGRIEHINVTNESAAKSNLEPFTSYVPCAIVSRIPGHGAQMEFKGELYTRKWSLDPINVFVTEPLRS